MERADHERRPSQPRFGLIFISSGMASWQPRGESLAFLFARARRWGEEPREHLRPDGPVTGSWFLYGFVSRRRAISGGGGDLVGHKLGLGLESGRAGSLFSPWSDLDPIGAGFPVGWVIATCFTQSAQRHGEHRDGWFWGDVEGGVAGALSATLVGVVDTVRVAFSVVVVVVLCALRVSVTPV